MEKGSKIGESPEGDIAIPEFGKDETKIKQTEKFGNSHLDETIDARNISNEQLFKVMFEYSDSLPADVVAILDKKLKKGKITAEEQSRIDRAKGKWFFERFGVTFAARKSLPEKSFKMTIGQRIDKDIIIPVKKSRAEKQEGKRSRELEDSSRIKRKKMELLRRAIQNLDNGEPVDEFRDESRRILYFDEENQAYYIQENGIKKNLGVGDILADYAWGIKYVPDGEMTKPEYRKITKRILANEGRRDLEDIYDHELVQKNPGKLSPPFSHLVFLEKLSRRSWKIDPHTTGNLAEEVVRELLSRIGLNNNLPFVISRANILEDHIYKYDFKIRVYNKNRGIDVESIEPRKSKSLKVGFQLKTHPKDQEAVVKRGVYSKGHKIEVDEVLILYVTTNEFGKAIESWLEAGKPSGGPEQFLSRDLKIKLLREVTRGLVEISDKDIERIFPAD